MKLVALLSLFGVLIPFPNALCKQRLLSEVATTEGLTTFTDLLTKAGLGDLLSREDGNPITVFAPTNEAFNRLPADVLRSLESDPTKLRGVLLYHTVPSMLKSADIVNDVSVNTSEGIPLRTNVYLKSEFYPGFVTVNGRRVGKIDQEADNGVIHTLADVAYPFPRESVWAALEQDNEARFTTLITAVRKDSALLEKLQSSATPITLFAPTDEAFKRIPEDKLKALLEDKERLSKVLLRHVVPGTLFQKGITWMVHDTLSPTEKVQTQVFKGGVTKVVSLEGGARIKEADIVARNGVVHAIDHVI